MTFDTERPSGSRLRAPRTSLSQTKPSVLAQLDEVELTPSDVVAMLDLLEKNAQCLEVRVKVSEAEQGFHQATLREVTQRLETGTLCSAQMLYEFDEARWLDTLIPLPRCVRVVRLQLSLG